MDFLKPDYSAEVESVFMDYTMAILETDKYLKVLEACYAGDRGPKYNLPSWCRDSSHPFSGCLFMQLSYDDLYGAATLRDPPTVCRIPRDVLCVRGVMIDEISVRYSGSMADDDFDFLRAWHMLHLLLVLLTTLIFWRAGKLSRVGNAWTAISQILGPSTEDWIKDADTVDDKMVKKWLKARGLHETLVRVKDVQGHVQLVQKNTVS